jgi:hypothetical protein
MYVVRWQQQSAMIGRHFILGTTVISGDISYAATFDIQQFICVFGMHFKTKGDHSPTQQSTDGFFNPDEVCPWQLFNRTLVLKF